MSDKFIVVHDSRHFVNAIADAVIAKMLKKMSEGDTSLPIAKSSMQQKLIIESHEMKMEEVMKKLRVSRTTLYNWKKIGKLVPLNESKPYKYSKYDVEGLSAA